MTQVITKRKFGDITLLHLIDGDRSQHRLEHVLPEGNFKSPWVSTNLPLTYERHGRAFAAQAIWTPRQHDFPLLFEILPGDNMTLLATGL